MRKSAIIGMAAFYLFLTTGMFVCSIHCMADYVSGKKQIPKTEDCSHHASKKRIKLIAAISMRIMLSKKLSP
jgi:hypothetical protein